MLKIKEDKTRKERNMYKRSFKINALDILQGTEDRFMNNVLYTVIHQSLNSLSLNTVSNMTQKKKIYKVTNKNLNTIWQNVHLVMVCHEHVSIAYTRFVT